MSNRESKRLATSGTSAIVDVAIIEMWSPECSLIGVRETLVDLVFKDEIDREHLMPNYWYVANSTKSTGG